MLDPFRPHKKEEPEDEKDAGNMAPQSNTASNPAQPQEDGIPESAPQEEFLPSIPASSLDSQEAETEEAELLDLLNRDFGSYDKYLPPSRPI